MLDLVAINALSKMSEGTAGTRLKHASYYKDILSTADDFISRGWR